MARKQENEFQINRFAVSNPSAPCEHLVPFAPLVVNIFTPANVKYELCVTSDILVEYADNADFIVSEDRHFDVLKRIAFPSVVATRTIEFKRILAEST